MSNRSVSILLIMLSFIISSCGDGELKEEVVTIVTEMEPNNDIENAMSITPDTVYQGYINEKLDQDWYRITLPEDSSAVLRVELGGINDINLKMELFEPDKNLLLDVNRYKEGEGEIITNYTLRPGDTYLRVRELWLKSKEKKFNDTLSYDLKIQLSALEPGVEQEPNNKAVEATPMTAHTAMQGYISPYNDVDWYRLPLVHDENRYLKLTLSGVEKVDTKLSVYDPIEAVIQSADASGKGEAEEIINLGIDPEREFYYVVVQGGKWQTDETVPYELKAEFIETVNRMEFEPNDRIEKATALFEGDSICAFIDSGKDVDWYRIMTEASEKRVARIELKAVPGVDFKITLTNEWEEPVLVADDRGEQGDEYITNIGVSEGDKYFIKVESIKNGYNIDQKYCLFLKLRSSFKSEEFELNDDFDRANSIELTKTMEGYIHPSSDVDFYRFDSYGRSTSKMQIILSGIMKVNTNMTLYDSSMNEIATAAAKGPEGVERISFEAAPGTYFIKVFDNDGRESNYRDKYRLALFEER
ncbi:MAG: PPC domain-containing protein [candidate division KSB1 bacterium]|jgi:hypothetical protein|nr:PPC domain-containing protein [candidate division KSB1 bacterium]